jgi:hypothetical protein
MGILLHIFTTGYLITLHSIRQHVPYLKLKIQWINGLGMHVMHVMHVV